MHLHTSRPRRTDGEAGGVCVSVYGSNLVSLIGKLKLARSYDPKLIELRLDYLGPIKPSELQEIKRHLQGNEIITFRKRAEGGVAKLDRNSFKNILLDIISVCGPPFVDIEISTLESFPILVDSLRKSDSRLIASSHNFAETEQTSDLRRLVRIAANRYSPHSVKVVRKANEFNDNLRILSLYKIKDKINPSKLVAFCSGSLGLFSRISCVRFGSPFTYASLPDEATAPGQLDAGSMKTLLAGWR
jgi:3-dehydroquinate dehydratase / shikimate dehydrogenase